MGFKDKLQARLYKRQWMRDRRAMYLDGKKCNVCGATSNLYVRWYPKTKKRLTFSATIYKLEKYAENSKVFCKKDYDVDVRRARKTPLIHGTLKGYKTHYCRCRPCTDASSKHWREYRRKKQDALRAKAISSIDSAMEKLGIPRSMFE